MFKSVHKLGLCIKQNNIESVFASSISTNYTLVSCALWKRHCGSGRPTNINFYGKYGVHFNGKSCFVCNKKDINTEHGLLLHLQSKNHLTMILHRLKLQPSEKNMLKTNFQALYKQFRQRNMSIESLDCLKNHNDTKNMIDIAPFLVNNINNDQNVKTMNRNTEEQMNQVKRREQGNIDRGMITGAIAPLESNKNDKNISNIKQKIRNCVNIDQIYEILKDKTNIPDDIGIYSLAIKKCSKFGGPQWRDCMKLIQMVFDRGIPRSVGFYGIVFQAASDNDRFIDVFPKMTNRMQHDGIDHNIITINSLLHGCVSRGNCDTAKKIISIAEKSNIQLDVKSYTILITMYGIADKIDNVVKLFHESPMIDMRLFAAFLNACSRTGSIDILLKYKKLFDCGKIGSINSNWNVKTGNNSLKPDASYYSILMSAYLKSNKPLDAITMFDEMKKQKYIKPNNECLGLLHAAHLRIQLLSTNEKDRLKEFYNTTIVIPKMETLNKQQRLNNDTVGRLIVSILHCYGQHRWYEARIFIQRLMKEYDYKYWIVDSYTQRVLFDVHGFSVPEIVFFLRYAFGEDMKNILKYTNNGRNNLSISTGFGKHRQGNRRQGNDSQGSVTQNVILHELLSWTQMVKCSKGEGKKNGIVIIPATEIKRFQLASVIEKQKFYNQTTFTCTKFDKYWTDHADNSIINNTFLKFTK